LKAGEYDFPAGVSAASVRDMLVAGRTVIHRLTVPEGLTTAAVLELLRNTERLVGELPNPGEGRLLPETYYYSYGDSRAGLVARMQRAMDEALARLFRARPPDSPLKSETELLTLASIVEKETGMSAERARVAGVFINRLKRRMRLQTDPTVIYALTGGQPLGRALTRADLRLDHAYNTYRNHGLPPGPIANPGLAALEASARPADTDALYFVADGAGGHLFARTLREHNRNVARYRKLSRRAR
ncbi:MAG: endolytic transglycosylase MltG, partial [Alphaproteobacteria bacterium]|nr:endolytic transglycosylase MltG [Alphaproteobacteria bacterium]